MAAPARLVEPRNPLHVYRHLLREASYLPPVCRTRLEPRIHLRFRRNTRDPTPEMRLRQARHDLRNMRAANLGDLGRMRRIMMLAFGRIGWRRHTLFAELRQLEQPDSSAQLEEHLREARPATDWLDRWNTDKILSFAKSQSKQSIWGSPRPKILSKKLDPAKAVPPMSVWGKPLTEKAARAKQRKWWIQCANRILPPLPRGEWDLLGQLATGQAGARWATPARRAPAVPVTTSAIGADAADGAEGGASAWEWQKFVTTPIRVAERPNSRRLRHSSGTRLAPANAPYNGEAIGIHTYTQRTWRRLYGEVWQMSSFLERKTDVKGKGWNVTWGGTPPPPLSPSTANLELFEGVDSKGKVPGRQETQKPVTGQRGPRQRAPRQTAERRAGP